MSQIKDGFDAPQPVVDRQVRPGALWRVLIFGIALIVAGSAFVLFRKQVDEPFLLGVLAILAMVGIAYLFASVIGIIRFDARSTGDALSKTYLDGLPQGVIVMDPKDRVVYANQAYADLVGHTESATELRTVSNLFRDHDEHSNTFYRLSRRVQDDEVVEQEFRLPGGFKVERPAKDAPAHWYRLRGRSITVPEYGGRLFAWQIADISDEREAQERYFADLQKAIDHLDSAPAGFIATNEAFQVTYLNATLADWLNVDLGAFQPDSVNLADFVAGEGLALLQPSPSEKGHDYHSTIDLDLTKSNGSALPVRLLYSALYDASGAFVGTRSVVLNSQAQGGDAAGDADVRFTRFFNSTPMAIASIDGNGRILKTNAPFASLFGRLIPSDAIMRGATLDSVLVDRDKERFHEALLLARQGRASIPPVDIVMGEGDDEKHARFYVNAIAGADPQEMEDNKEAETAIVYAVDTTEQKALEAQMAQGQKMQAVGQLAGGIAHDFNNVLSAIVLSSDLLLGNHRPSDPSFSDIMSIKQNANRAASLVRQLLAFSRRQTLRPQTLNLTDVLADVRMLLQRLVGNEITLEINHGRDLWSVRADLGQFEQVVVNLAVNARDAMKGGGHIEISTENIDSREIKRKEMPVADYVRVSVRDTGTGIAPDVLKQIFEPFFTTKEIGKGTGLGLSMVYGIIKQSDGFIYADSEIGTGTTFHIYLPRYEPTESELAIEAPTVPQAPQKKKDHSGSGVVLLAEDEDAVRMGAVRALKTRGYTVIEASTGAEALELYEESDVTIDIVVSDVRMPEMDGPTLFTELLKIKPDIKFIFMSGYTEDALANERFEGVDYGFLAKPFSLKQLATTVKEHLER